MLDTITLNGNKMTSKQVLHRYLARKLEFPDYFGNNLDALYDCLTEIGEPVHIDVIHTDRIRKCLDYYGETFLQVLEDAAAENSHLTICFYEGINTSTEQ